MEINLYIHVYESVCACAYRDVWIELIWDLRYVILCTRTYMHILWQYKLFRLIKIENEHKQNFDQTILKPDCSPFNRIKYVR